MLSLGLRPDEIGSRLREIQFHAPVGVLEERQSRVFIAVRNDAISVEELERHVVATTSNGVAVRIRDIGSVKDGLSEARSFYRINGKSTVTIVIDKEPNTNTLSLANTVFERLGTLKSEFPAGFGLIKESDKSQQMRKELEKLYQEILISLLSIFVILLLFLRNLKAPFLILSSILFSVAGTFVLFWLFGIGLNLLTLAGLVLGFGRLVDDSIVVLENINRHLVAESGERFPTVARSVSEIALPVVASTLTTVGALLPLSFLPQDLKPYFLDFGIAVGVSLLMSLIVSFTLIPTVAAHRDVVKIDFRFLDRVGSGVLYAYERLLRRALLHRKLVIALTLWLFGIPLWLLPPKIESEGWIASAYNSSFGSETYASIKPYVDYALGGTSHLFFSKVTKGEVWSFGEQTYLIAYVSFPQGTEIERYDQIAEEIERLALVENHGLEKVTSRVQSDYAMVRIDIAESAANTALPFDLKNRLILYAAQTGGATIGVSGYGPGFYTGGEASPSFYVKILGYNYNKVKEIAEAFRQRIERNPRIAEVDIDRSFGRWNKTYELIVTVDREAIADHGLTVVEVLRAVRLYTRGSIEQSQLNIGGDRVPYAIKVAGYRDFSVDDLEQAMIVNQQGKKVRLGNLVKIAERRVPSQIQRENQQYLRMVSFEYKGPYRFGDRFVDATIKAMPLPSGYLFDRSFSFFWLTDSSQMSFLWIAVFALVIVFMITSSLYESFVKPFIIILSVPFSLVGLFLSFYVMDAPFGRGGYAAVVLLIGIVVTNSIVLVDYLAKKVVGANKTCDALIASASTRLRPVLMTTLTTIGGLLPLLLMGDETSLWYSLSLGTIGGLVSSTILTLVVVPWCMGYFHEWDEVNCRKGPKTEGRILQCARMRFLLAARRCRSSKAGARRNDMLSWF